MTTHFHVDHGNLPGYFLVRAMEPGDTGRECDCEAGEIELYHDECERDATPEDCPCGTCQAARLVRFREWTKQQLEAGIIL